MTHLVYNSLNLKQRASNAAHHATISRNNEEGWKGVRCEGVLRNHESVPTPQFIERIKR